MASICIAPALIFRLVELHDVNQFYVNCCMPPINSNTICRVRCGKSGNDKVLWKLRMHAINAWRFWIIIVRFICTCSAGNSYVIIIRFHPLQAHMYDSASFVYDLPASGTRDMIFIETTTNDAMTGRYCFKVDTAGEALACEGVYVWS